jgi:hypothetical protein
METFLQRRNFFVTSTDTNIQLIIKVAGAVEISQGWYAK